MDIGLELDILQPDLDEIKADFQGDTKKCFTEMLTRWLKQVDPPPTWSTLVAALQDPTIKEGSLAEQVESKHREAVYGGPAKKMRFKGPEEATSAPKINSAKGMSSNRIIIILL
jgi:hypothetical protein